ncbi:hypothetical protein VTK26DRAFT_6491 [Humicola hyalothermophila]
MPAAPASAESTPRPKGGPAPDRATFVPVRTTLPRRPLPPSHSRPHVTTDRLILRPLVPEDLDAIHALRSQPEVMHWTRLGVPDRDRDETCKKMAAYLSPSPSPSPSPSQPPPPDSYNCAICLRATGQLIGVGGCHNWASSLGWPEIGYMLRSEHWGRGLGTEFVRGFVEGVWETLEREVVEGLMVDARTVEGAQAGTGHDGVRNGEEGEGDGKGKTGGEGMAVVREQLIAITAEGNGKSQAVLQKSGFEWFLTLRAEDRVKGDGDGMINLPTYRYFYKGGKRE